MIQDKDFTMFDFLNLNMYKKESAEQVLEKLLREEFIYQLKQDSYLTIHSHSEKMIISHAITLDTKRNSLIIAEKNPEGILILERNDPVTIMTQINEDHEVFSFHSKVSNIILDDGEILYEVVIPKRIHKGQRRKGFRINIDSSSKVKLGGSVYTGQVDNLSNNGLLFTLDGYWPEPIEIGESLTQCHIETNFIQFDCNVNVRFINFEPYPARRTLIGGRLVGLSPLHKNQLSGFLASQQRLEQRKKAEIRDQIF